MSDLTPDQRAAAVDADDHEAEFIEGCPDCGRDSIVEDERGTICEHCGWRA